MSPTSSTSPAIGSQRARTVFPICSDRSMSPSASMTSSTASAAAQATGFPMYVPPMADGPGASMTSFGPMTAERG